ncbi:uncharacterized protein LOC130724831 [Lotus japonicus]|uniref:uncharacterized protein LOC130724831 n=1 Tax=Lotus japonicus TaxID=34305 RepID=UPI002589CEEE|nr:uncharacterized protein LOC130724831 [Lotus japonicus]
MVLGPRASEDRASKVDLIAHKLVRIELSEDARQPPKVFAADSVIENLSKPWKQALVVKLIGKNLGYSLMKSKLHSLWKPSGGFDIMMIDHGFYMVKFDKEEDREKVLHGGPWMIFDHCVAVAQWSPEFVPSTTATLKSMVWLRFPGLNPAFYEESFLLALAAVIGKPVKIDGATLDMHRGRYARVCVEIELSKPATTKIWFREQLIEVQYEGMHVICEHCGCFGHLGRNCLDPAKGNLRTLNDGGAAAKPNLAQVEGATVTPLERNSLPIMQDSRNDWIPVKRKNSKNKKHIKERFAGPRDLPLNSIKSNNSGAVKNAQADAASEKANASVGHKSPSPPPLTPLKRRRGPGGVAVVTAGGPQARIGTNTPSSKARQGARSFNREKNKDNKLPQGFVFAAADGRKTQGTAPCTIQRELQFGTGELHEEGEVVMEGS